MQRLHTIARRCYFRRHVGPSPTTFPGKTSETIVPLGPALGFGRPLAEKRIKEALLLLLQQQQQQ